MNRTKYYWALVECDSVSTASWLYDQMDGLEADGADLSNLRANMGQPFLEEFAVGKHSNCYIGI